MYLVISKNESNLNQMFMENIVPVLKYNSIMLMVHIYLKDII